MGTTPLHRTTVRRKSETARESAEPPMNLKQGNNENLKHLVKKGCSSQAFRKRKRSASLPHCFGLSLTEHLPQLSGRNRREKVQSMLFGLASRPELIVPVPTTVSPTILKTTFIKCMTRITF